MYAHHFKWNLEYRKVYVLASHIIQDPGKGPRHKPSAVARPFLSGWDQWMGQSPLLRVRIPKCVPTRPAGCDLELWSFSPWSYFPFCKLWGLDMAGGWSQRWGPHSEWLGQKQRHELKWQSRNPGWSFRAPEGRPVSRNTAGPGGERWHAQVRDLISAWVGRDEKPHPLPPPPTLNSLAACSSVALTTPLPYSSSLVYCRSVKCSCWEKPGKFQ